MKLPHAVWVLSLLLVALVPAAEADNLSAARDLMKRDMPYSASRKLNAIVDKDAESHGAWALLAECQLRLEDAEGAYESASNALDGDQKDPDYWKLLGRAAFKKGEQAYVARASSADIKGWYADAEAKFKQARKGNPADPEIQWRIGQAYEWQEQPKKAKKAYEQQIEKHPKVPEGYLRLGALLAGDATRIDNGQSDAAKAKREEAFAVFRKGLAKAGPNGEIHYNIGMAHEWNRDFDKAKEAYIAAVRSDPEINKAWKRLYEKLQVPPAELMPIAKEMLRKHPTSPTLSVWAGFFLNAENEYEQSLDILLPCLKEHGESGGVYNQAFTAALKLMGGKKDAALVAFAKIHEYYEFGGSAANNIGLHYRDTGQHKKSLEWYVKAMEREPENQDILNDTALIYLFHFRGETQKKCLPILQKVVSMVQDDGQKPLRGYWDALENLCKYYWEVERKPELVIEYADLRYIETNGVDPYNMSGTAKHYKKLAQGG